MIIIFSRDLSLPSSYSIGDHSDKVIIVIALRLLIISTNLFFDTITECRGSIEPLFYLSVLLINSESLFPVMQRNR